MAVPILRQGRYLVASVQASLGDAELIQLQDDLVRRVGRDHARGVIIDVTPLDVLDSFACRTLATIADAVGLRGARTVIIGIQPDVAFAMVQLGLALRGVETALDLEAGLDWLDWTARTSGRRGG